MKQKHSLTFSNTIFKNLSAEKKTVLGVYLAKFEETTDIKEIVDANSRDLQFTDDSLEQ